MIAAFTTPRGGSGAADDRGEVAVAARASSGGVTVEFGQLYDSYAEYVWRNLRRLGVTDADVDDALQDVFLVVHRRLPDFVASGSPKAWVFGITLRVARNYRRSTQRRGDPAPLRDDHIATAGPGPMEAALRTEGVQILERLLEHFDDDKREAFVLVDVEGLSLAEAAEILGLNVRTLQTRVRSARAQFEAAVERHHRSER